MYGRNTNIANTTSEIKIIYEIFEELKELYVDVAVPEAVGYEK